MTKVAKEKWEPLDAPPPPLFTGEPERNLIHQINTELLERVVGQTVLIYCINHAYTDYHSLYGESIQKVFHDPIHVHARVEFVSQDTNVSGYGIDKRSQIKVWLHKKRIENDQKLIVKEGDMVRHGDLFYEVARLEDNRRWMFGQAEYQFEVLLHCIRSRQSLFDGT